MSSDIKKLEIEKLSEAVVVQSMCYVLVQDLPGELCWVSAENSNYLRLKTFEQNYGLGSHLGL